MLPYPEPDLHRAVELLAFHEGSEAPEHEGAQPTVRINARDFAEALEIVRRAAGTCLNGCRGIEIAPGEFSGCSCPEGTLANGEPWPPGFRCDCPNHPEDR